MPNLTRIKNNQVTDSTIVASAKLVARSITGGLLSDPISYSGNMTIAGNLTVQGTTTTVDTTNTLVADPVIVLSRGETGTPSNDSGFLVERGTSNNAAFLWDETNDQFVAITTVDDGSVAGSITQTAFANLKVANLIATVGSSFGNIKISGNTIESTDTNGNVNITPNGSGDINLSADTVVVGDSNTQAVVTTNGTGNLFLSTNSGTNSGNIKIAQGADGNITITTNGTGEVVTNTLAVSDLTSGRFVLAGTSGAVQDSSSFSYSGSDMTVAGDIAINGGDITTTATTFTVANANATTVHIGGAATAVNIGAATGTTIIKNALDVDSTINMDGASFTTTAATVALMNANTTTINFGGAATAVNIGAATGTTIVKNDLQVDGGDLSFGAATTANIANATVTTLNLGGAATTVEIGAATGTTNINNNLDVDGNINMDGGNFTTTAATVNLANANSTTVNFAGAATTLEIGAATGTTNINNNLDVDGNINMDGGNFTTTAATVNLANANTTTLNVGGAATAVNIGAATGTTIVKNDLQVDGGDLTFGAATTANIANATVTTLNIGGAATTTTIGSSAGNVVVAGDLRINGNDILSSTGNSAITLNNIDVTVHGNLTVQGATTTIGSQDLTVEDSIINLHTQANLAALTSDDGRDIGIKFHYYKTSDKHAFVGWANDTGYLEYYSDATEGVGNVITGTYGTIKANIYYANVATGTAPFTVNSTTRVANLNVAAAGTANTVVDAAQPNITSLGTLTTLNVNAQVNATIFSSNVSTGTAPLTVTSTTQVANLNVAVAGSLINGTSNVTIPSTNGNVTISSAGNANVVVITGTGANISNLSLVNNTLASTATNANINLTPNGTGQVVIANAAVSTLTSGRVTYAGSNGTLTDNTNLQFSGTLLTVTGSANISSTANIGNIQITGNTVSSIDVNGNVNITPNGTGDINLSADTVVVGDSNTQAVVTTNGTGNLFLSTNSGTNSGNVVITQGANGNITFTANGTGEVVTNTLAVSDLTSTRVTYAGANGALVDNANLTFSGTLLTVTGDLTVSGTGNIGNIRTSANTISSTNTNGNINLDPNGTGSLVINSTGDNTDLYVNANLTTYPSTPVLYTKASSGQVGIMTASPSTGVSLHVNTTDSMLIPKGSTGDRPTGIAGMIRFNTSLSILEFFDGTTWQSTQGSFTVIAYQNASGDGSTVNYTLNSSSTTAATLVAINGVLQKPADAYSVSGTTLTFTEAPQSGDDIDIRLMTTTTTVSSLADGDTSVSIADTGSNGTVTVKADGTNVAYWNSSIYSQSKPTVAAVSGTSVGLSATTVDSFSASTYRSAKYVVQISNSGRGDYETQEIIVTHDGTTASRAAYGIVYSNVALATSSVTISGGNVLLQITGNYTGNTVKVAATYIPV